MIEPRRANHTSNPALKLLLNVYIGGRFSYKLCNFRINTRASDKNIRYIMAISFDIMI